MNITNAVEKSLAKGEIIQSVVIGAFGWGGGYAEDRSNHKIPKSKLFKVLEWPKARKLLDYDFDGGFGAPECHAVYIWTNRRIIWINEYDGSTSLADISRNPIKCEPQMSGG